MIFKNKNKTKSGNLFSQEISGVQGKMSAMQEDQRQLRCHWLAEKNELETRCFQAQGLVTQYMGTLRKKDKDYEKLQGQLAKMVKDSSRGQKSVIVITKPLPKNFQEKLKPAVTLKDVELADARAVGVALETENNNLRNMLNTLTVNFEEVQRKLTMNHISEIMNQSVDSPVPVVATPSKDYSCSPLARPFQSVVKQVSSTAEEAIRLSISPPRCAVKDGDESEIIMNLQTSLSELKAKLMASQAVIAEQGTLIHAGQSFHQSVQI